MTIEVQVKLVEFYTLTFVETALEKNGWTPTFLDRDSGGTDWTEPKYGFSVKLHQKRNMVGTIGLFVPHASRFWPAELSAAFSWLFEGLKWKVKEGRYSFVIPTPMHRLVMSISRSSYQWLGMEYDKESLEVLGKGFVLHFKNVCSEKVDGPASQVSITMGSGILSKVSKAVDLVDSDACFDLMQEKLPAFEWFRPWERRLYNGVVETDDPSIEKNAGTVAPS